MSIPTRKELRPGIAVQIIQKHHQRSGELTEGVIERLLTKVSSHPYGIKVKLTTGKVGRVQEVIEDAA